MYSTMGIYGVSLHALASYPNAFFFLLQEPMLNSNHMMSVMCAILDECFMHSEC